jgi:hypothetical protein
MVNLLPHIPPPHCHCTNSFKCRARHGWIKVAVKVWSKHLCRRRILLRKNVTASKEGRKQASRQSTSPRKLWWHSKTLLLSLIQPGSSTSLKARHWNHPIHINTTYPLLEYPWFDPRKDRLPEGALSKFRNCYLLPPSKLHVQPTVTPFIQSF